MNEQVPADPRAAAYLALYYSCIEWGLKAIGKLAVLTFAWWVLT